MRSRLLLCLLMLLMPVSALAQEGDPQVKPIKDGLVLLVSPMGGNVIASSGDDGIFVIDDQLTDRSQIIDAALKKLSDKPLRFIVNTHYHFDHTGGNEAFGGQGAIIVAHDKVRERLSSKQFVTFFQKEMEPLAKEGLPVVTFSQNMSFHYNGDQIDIIHVPAAHTDGDVIAHFKEKNVIVAGDTVFNGMYPFIDVEHGGSIKGVIASVDTMIGLADEQTIIVPGHGGLMSLDDLKAYGEMLKAIAGKIEVLIAEGKTLEEVKAARPTQDYEAKVTAWKVGPEEFVTILYESLKQ